MNPAAPNEPRVQVIDPSGNAGTVPASELEQAQTAGYRAVTDPAELKAIQDKEDNQGFLPAAQAALMGIGRGLTFGGSDEALIKGGAVSADTAKNLMEYQPVASEVGKLGGQLAPMLVPGVAEEEAPEVASEFLGQAARAVTAPVRAVSTMGEAVQRSVTGTLGTGWLGKLGGAAARGAVEGGVYGAGDDVTEDAIGNKPMTAESLMATAGAGALLGAPIGAGFEGLLGLSQKVVPSVMERAGDQIKKVADKWTKGMPDSVAEVREYATDLQKANDGMAAAKQDFETGAKQEYAASVLGAQNKAGPAANQFVADLDAQYGVRKVQSANTEARAAFTAAEEAERAQQKFFSKYHTEDKYEHVRDLIGNQPVNPSVTYDLERALGNLAESQFGSATLDKFKHVIGEYATNFKDYLSTNEILKESQAELAALEAAGPQRASAGLSEVETLKHANDAAVAWHQRINALPPNIKLGPEALAADRMQFVEKYLADRSAERLTQATEENARLAVQHEGQVKELKRHIDATQAHLNELPGVKNRADQFEALDKLRKNLNLIKKPVLETERDRLMFDRVKRASEEIGGMLKEEGLFGEAAKYQKAVNDVLHRHISSETAFRSTFMKRATSTAEKASGKFFLESRKLNGFIHGLAKGDPGMDSIAARWASHISDTTTAADEIANLTFANKPHRMQDAQDLIAKMGMADSKIKTAAAKLAAVRDAARAPRAAPLGQARAVTRWGSMLESSLKNAKTDADRFSALDEIYQKMGRAAKLTPAEESVRKQIGTMLQDTNLFGEAAKMHVASETVFAQAKMARDALEQRFFKPVPGKVTPQIRTGSVENHVNQFARGQARAADAVNTVNEYVQASRKALDYLHQEVYPKLTTPKTTRSTEAFLNKVEEQRAKAAAARKYDLDNPKSRHPFTGVAHGGALAVGLHALGIHAALPAYLLYRVLRNPTQTLHVVGTAAGHTANVIKKIGDLSKIVFKRTEGKAAALAGPAVSEILQGTHLGTKPADKESRTESTRRVIGDLVKLGQPEEFDRRMGSTLATLKLRAPEVAGMVVNRGQTAVSYLLAHSPAAASPDAELPGQRPAVMSDRDMFEFGQRVRAVGNPLSILEDMQRGKLSANAVDAVKTVYPEIYKAAVAGVKEQLIHQQETLTAGQQQQLSTLLGTPVGAIQKMLPALQKGATSPLPEQPTLDNGTQPQKKLPGTFTKLGESERTGTNLSSTQHKESAP